MLKLAIFLIIMMTFGAEILRLIGKIFLSALSLTFSAASFLFKWFCVIFILLAGAVFIILQKLMPFAAKHLSAAATWIVAAVVTVGLLIYAAGRNIFHGESITEFIEKLIPHKETSSRRTDFSILAIELADSIQNDISEKLKAQYETVLNFFKPSDIRE